MANVHEGDKVEATVDFISSLHNLREQLLMYSIV